MCGIIGYIGNREAKEILLKGLFDLEYRGYDSAGLKMLGNPVFKAVGPVKNLQSIINDDKPSTIGIAHTRWATHGLPTTENSHPHSGQNDKVWLVHNGIIENYKELKKELEKNGNIFKSSTDSEVLAHLIEDEFEKNNSLKTAVINSLKKVKGTYGIAVQSDAEPDSLVVAKMGSPIAIGIGETEYVVSSDISSIIKHTKNIIYLEDGEVAVLKKDSHQIENLLNQLIDRDPEVVDWDVENAQKNGFDHYMLKEIFETPDVITDSIRGRILDSLDEVKLGGLESVLDKLKNINKIHIVGCGSAYYAGLYGKYLLEELAGISVSVDYASEFRYMNQVLDKEAVVLAISQSGETADTLEAVREAKKKGTLTLGIVNAVGSTISRETDAGIYNHAGPEISVASTKAFISQITVLVLLTVFIGRMRKMSKSTSREILSELQNLPEKIKTLLDNCDSVKDLAKEYKDYKNFLFIGRKYNFPIAMEGALKLKEVSYIHAEGIGSGELKHGPLAMIDENFPVVALCPNDSVYEKNISNIEEIKSRNGKVLLISDFQNDEYDDFIKIPKTVESLSGILNLIPLQLFAYYISIEKGLNVDRPRNLAKSVTVE